MTSGRMLWRAIGMAAALGVGPVAAAVAQSSGSQARTLEGTWYVQVVLVVLGHAAGLALAHDRALVLYDDPRAATRSQLWMLAVMIGFTSLALWLLSQANA